MSITSIAGSTYTESSPSQPASAQAPNVKQSEPVVKDTTDTVHLSVNAQVKQLSQSGESASAIANNTGLTVTEVDSDLGITTAALSAPVAVPSGGGGPPAAAKAAPAVAAPETATAPETPTISVKA